MTKIDESTRLIIESLPETLKQLIYLSLEVGYFSKNDLLNASKSEDLSKEDLLNITEFMEQDLGLELIETPDYDYEQYSDEEDTNFDKSRDAFNSSNQEFDSEDEEYKFYACQLEKSTNGTQISFGVQDSVQSYLKQINTVQLLTAGGEVAIAKRIEVATRLLMFGLCESPITIQSLLNWYSEYSKSEIKLQYLIDLDLMYSSFIDKKAKSQEDEEDIEDDTNDDIDEEVECDEDDEDKVVSHKKGTTGVPVAIMEEALTPIVIELFSKISKIFNNIQKIQTERLATLSKSSKLDNKLEDKYLKLRLKLFDIIGKIYFNEDRITEILDKLTEKSSLLRGLEGKIFRLSQSGNKKLSLADFLNEYTGNEINQSWTKKLLKHKNTLFVNFAKKHEKEINQIQKDIYEIALNLGQPVFEYKQVVELVKKGLNETSRAKREMIEANLRLVVKSAKKFSGRGMGLDLSDLIQDGNIGLMKAVDKFDYRLGNKFSTYATNWITQSISRSISCNGRTIRIPVHMIDNINKKDKAIRKFMHKYGREPTVAEISKMTYLSEDKIYKAMKVNIRPISIEKPIGDDEDNDRSQIIPNDKARDPVDYAVQKNLRRILTLTLATLEPTEEMVLRKRKGMGGENIEYTLEEVGAYLGLTRERVRQIQEKAKNKLLHPTRAKILKSFYEN